MIGIVDYGVGNVGAILNMLTRAGEHAELVRTPAEVLASDRLLLPGVGHFDGAMLAFRAVPGLADAVRSAALDQRKPLLGVCVGMQMLARGSEEGTTPGLGWIEAEVRRIRPADPKLKVPHVGWNHVEVRGEPLFAGIERPRFYFTHSYAVVPDHEGIIAGRTQYGGAFCSALHAGNLYGVQFHPEKSHNYGLRLLANFARI